MGSVLTRDGLEDIFETVVVNDLVNKKGRAAIRPAIEDGTLLLIRAEKCAHEILNSLKKLYSPQGFLHSFLVWVKLQLCKLKNFNSMENLIVG